MNPQTYESSGYLIDGFEGIDHHFTNIEIIKNTEYNILAKAKRYGRWWMLKAIRAEEDKQTVFQQMLRKELEILMQMQHPNIVQASGMEYVETLGMCIVMEYVDGIQLDEWLNSPKSKENRFRLAEELLKAVEYIHTSGTVHRDLKPSNIMVTRNGENIKLIDFGLADNDHIAILKQPAGTPKYMSPEQAANSIPDIRNDIYSLGIILQQLLPEKAFKSIIGKCFLPIETRYKSVSLLLQDINKQKKKKKTFINTVIGALIVCLSAGVTLQTYKLQKIENNRNRIDSTIKEGTKIIDMTYDKIGMEERLDTCTQYSYIDEKYRTHFLDGSHAANKFIDSIRPYFTDTEMYEITNAITIHNGNRLKVWTEKIEPLINKLTNKP
jgi:serine/threonine protein kinase